MNGTIVASRKNKAVVIRNTFCASAFALLIFTVVIPNSLKIYAAGAMVWCFVLALMIVRVSRAMSHMFMLYLASVSVTVLYIFGWR